MDSSVVALEEHLTLEELSKRRKLRMCWLYERSRRDALPGMRRYGRHIRIILSEFDKGVKEGALA